MIIDINVGTQSTTYLSSNSELSRFAKRASISTLLVGILRARCLQTKTNSIWLVRKEEGTMRLTLLPWYNQVMLSWAWIRIDLCHLLAQTKPTHMVDLIPSLENEFGSINLGALINSFLNLNNLLFVVCNYFMEFVWKLAYFSIIHCHDRVFFPHNPNGQVDLEYHL